MPCTDLTPEEHKVFDALVKRKNRLGYASISTQTISNDTDLSLTTVHAAVQGLRDVGFIESDGATWLVLERCTCKELAVLKRSLTQDPVEVAPGNAPLVSYLASSKPYGAADRGSVPSPSGPSDGHPSQAVSSVSTTSLRRIVKRRYSKLPRHQKPPFAWTARDLASHFQELAIETWVGTGPGPVNVDALAGSFARWRKNDGIEPAVAKVMIDLFLNGSVPGQRSSTPLWQTFLRLRAKLYEDARRMVEAGDWDDRPLQGDTHDE